MENLIALRAGGKRLRRFSMPALEVAVLSHGAVRQQHLPGRVDRLHLPRDTEQLADHIVRPAFVKTAGQRGAGVEAVFLMIERAGTAAGIHMRFKDSHLMAGFCQQRGCRRAAHTCAHHQHF